MLKWHFLKKIFKEIFGRKWVYAFAVQKLLEEL